MFTSFTHLSQVKTFTQLRALLDTQFLMSADEVHTTRWQGEDISKRPEGSTFELLNCSFTMPLNGIEHLPHWQYDVKPNLPWADDHFEERVCGAPINPGVEWANWPWGGNAEKFLQPNGMFNHNYMERYWPLHARGDLGEPSLTAKEWNINEQNDADGKPLWRNQGIRGEYGDLHSLVQLLIEQPDTRQAWLPIFFPEDTGNTNPGRKPCTLGYQFIVRDNKLHVYYPLRSCDYIKHFNDDIYLTIRLLLWILQECRSASGSWHAIEPGSYTMHCTSLHVFKNDHIELQRKYGKL